MKFWKRFFWRLIWIDGLFKSDNFNDDKLKAVISLKGYISKNVSFEIF